MDMDIRKWRFFRRERHLSIMSISAAKAFRWKYSYIIILMDCQNCYLAVNGKFQGGFVPWYGIKSSCLTNPAYRQENQAKTKSSYAYNEQEGTFLGFESPQSLKDKIDYATEKNVGGLIIWVIDQDDDEYCFICSFMQKYRSKSNLFVNVHH